MCVFLSLRADKAHLKKRFDATFVEEERFGPTYVKSAFEFSKWPVISTDRPGEIQLMNWGLIPSWIKDQGSALKFRAQTVNARCETILEKPAFRAAARNQHCLVLADGFFEFREVNGKKYPYYIRLRGGEAFALAGLYDRWTNTQNGETVASFTIITTEANLLLEKIHNRGKRMPVLLAEHRERDWLRPGNLFYDLLQPFPDDQMEAWTVMKKPGGHGGLNNAPETLLPFSYPELESQEPHQGLLF